jgi:hypothetical protein
MFLAILYALGTLLQHCVILVHLHSGTGLEHNLSAARQSDSRLSRSRLNSAAFEQSGVSPNGSAIDLEIAWGLDHSNRWWRCHQEKQAAAGQERKERS